MDPGSGRQSSLAEGTRSEWQVKGGEKVEHLDRTFQWQEVWGAVWQEPLRDMGPHGRALVWAVAGAGLRTLT